MRTSTKFLISIWLWTLCPFFTSASADSQIFYRLNQTLYAMNEDGQAMTRVFTNPLPSWLKSVPSWSPDGTRIVLSGQQPTGQSADIFLIEVASGNITNLTNDLVNNYDPVWSPDGTQIAYECIEQGPVGRIYIMNADGSGAFPLTDVESSHPAWSPDGRKIAFERNVQNGGHLYGVDLETRGIEPLFESSVYQSILYIAWSPDGRYIGYIANPDPDLNYQVYLFDIQTRTTQRITSEGHNFQFAWSPDGTWIALNSTRNGIVDIYVVDVESGMEQAMNVAGAKVIGWYDFARTTAVMAADRKITAWGILKAPSRE